MHSFLLLLQWHGNGGTMAEYAVFFPICANIFGMTEMKIILTYHQSSNAILELLVEFGMETWMAELLKTLYKI